MTSTPAASIIVRAKNEERTIGRALELLRRQTVPVEIVVVDSGSTDRTVDIARGLCDRLVEIPAGEFTFGRALNAGAAAASAPVQGAVSAHCFVERSDWVERSLVHYEHVDVAATNGLDGMPDGSPPLGVLYQTSDLPTDNPWWGFSNHASTWRASAWKQFPFDEQIAACEDREWAKRVLDAGLRIAFDPDLVVPLTHRWRAGPADYFKRIRRETRALSTFIELPPYGLRDCVRQWWSRLPDDRHSRSFHRFVNYYRLAEIAGRYAGSPSPRRRKP